MELVYLYAGQMGKCIDNTGINFSKKFEVTYDQNTQRITIQRKPVTEEREKLFGDNIEDISVIVGKNGTGKSMIMRLLGLPRIEYLNYFGFLDEKSIHSWFALYYLQDDEFIIEGSHAPILNGNFRSAKANQDVNADGDEIEIFEKSGLGLMPIYCIRFRYDIDGGSEEPDLFTDITQMEVPGPSGYDERFKDIFYLFFRNPAGVSWFDDYTPAQSIYVRNDNRLRRVVSDRSSLTTILEYLLQTQNDENDYSKRIGNMPGAAIRLELRRHQGFNGFDWIDISHSEEITKRSDFEKEIAKRIYCNSDIVPLWSYDGISNTSHSGFSHNKHFILAYLENLVYEYIEERSNFIPDYDPSEEIMPFENSDEMDYEKRKAFLKKYLDEVGYDKDYFGVIVEKLEAIPGKYFTANNALEMPIREAKDSSILEIINRLDENEHGNYSSDIVLKNKKFLHVSFTDMSSGEAHFIDVLSSIDGALRKWKKNNKADENYGNTCILLMDEPDTAFHPEWSRSFIKNLVDYLNSKDVTFKFQVIIATHSPLLLSDIPSDSIICINKTKVKSSEQNAYKLEISNPSYGMLSGINDILIDNFFTNSLFGEFAEEFANEIVNDLEELEDKIDERHIDKNEYDEKYESLKDRIDILGKGIVKDSLMLRLNMTKRWIEMVTYNDKA